MHCLLLILVGLLVPAVAPPDAGEADFLRGYAVVRQLAGIRRWSGASRQLDELLARHEQRDYVTPHLAQIAELYERCAFFSAYPEPDPAGLIKGHLDAWDAGSGRIVLRYDELPGDFERSNGLLLHPLEFTGAYQVTLTGRMPAQIAADETPPPIQLLVGVSGEDSYQVLLGLPRFEQGTQVKWISPALIENRDGSSTTLAESDGSPLEFGRPFKIDVRVTETSLTVTVDSETLFRVTKSRGPLGRVALLGTTGVERVVLSGIGNPSWLRGRIDEVVVHARAAFRRTWNPAEHIPVWVLEAAPQPDAGSARASLTFERRVNNAHIPALERLSELYAAGDIPRGLDELQAMGSSDLPDEFRHLFRGLFLLDAERLPEALSALEQAVAAAPHFVEANVLRGRVLGRQGHVDRALTVLREIIADDPSSPLAWSECARWCLRSGRPAEAKTVVDRALRRGIDPLALADVQSVLTRALEGPPWERTYEYSSAHYRVRSDVNRQICFEASRVLEDARRLYEHRFGRLARGSCRASGLSPGRSPVFVFSGSSGYDEYGRDVFGLAPETTAGAFSPILKQLLVWSPPNAEDMWKTLRHEGLHQYMDQRFGAVPVWLNEGLAEYFENTTSERGRAVNGVPHTQHLTTLLTAKRDWVPFDELLAMGPQEFYADPAIHYPQSWALVHWLLKSGLSAGRICQAVLDDLAEGASYEELRARLLAVEGLERKVREHLATL